MLFLDACEDPNFLSVVGTIKEVINVISIVVPVLLIVLCGVDIAKKVFDDKFQAIAKISKRMIAASLVFFVPLFVTVLLDNLDQEGFTQTACWTNANEGTIAQLQALESAKEEAQKEKDKIENDAAREAREKQEEYKEEVRKKKQEEADKKKPSDYNGNGGGNNGNNGGSTGPESGELLNENGKDGMVEVINGKFYIKSTGKSGVEGTKGSAPYGYNKFFFARLEKFLADAKAAGHTINYSTSEYGAWRPIAKQEYFYNCYITKACNNGNLAAQPGTSNHGWGIASDLSFGGTNALYWAHDNCSKYGLKFPLCADVRGSCTENWHIEPASLTKG